ncbi:MAG: alpha/beta hydrolase [Clostridiaceae bacterium]|nr:alpha/beta hydrolase [Clostridiaceae bacterium]
MVVNIGDVSFNYNEFGEGKPVLMLHGYCLDHRVMESAFEPVFMKNKGFRRIYIDLPGMGLSTGEDSIKNCDDMLEILLEFIDKVIGKEHFMIFGYSYGGYLARAILQRYEEMVDGLLLLCPVIIPNYKDRNIASSTVLEKDEEFVQTLSQIEDDDYLSEFVIQNEFTYRRYVNDIRDALSLAKKDFVKEYKKNGYELTDNLNEVSKVFGKPMVT